MRSKTWFALFSGDVYAIQFDYHKPISEREFRKRLRAFEGIKRIPYGTQVWAN